MIKTLHLIRFDVIELKNSKDRKRMFQIKETGRTINLLSLHRKRNTETDINWNLSYGTVPGIE